MYIALAKKQGADLKQLSGTVQNDILKEYAARGTYIYPPKPSMRLITDLFEYCGTVVPKWNTISVSGYHIREAGSSAVQELAFTLANGKAYLKAAIDKGLDINDFAKRVSFFFNCHNNFFEEIAKLRASRRIWAQITKELGATDIAAQKLRFHTQTGGSTLTAQQPLNNIARIANQAMAAVLGGTQSLHTNGYDEAISLPSEEAAKLALRTQQILAFESGVAATADPLAGSYFIEELTDEMEKAAWVYINKIDEMGGSVNAIESGYIQNEIASSSYEYQKDIENGQRIIVGVNQYTDTDAPATPAFRTDDSARKLQTEALTVLKIERDSALVKNALARLSAASRNDENLMPIIVGCVEVYATLGEISDTMRDVFGEY
jgi:methylmalonyl-CoA mutase N-terminal domain/subunit